MLEVAKTNLSDEKLVLADMTDFNFNKYLFLIVCGNKKFCLV